MLSVSTPGPFESSDDDEPWSNMPLDLGAIFRAVGGLTGQGPNWDSARQMAAAIATEGASEPNIDPMVRLTIEQLARVAELHVATLTGLTPSHAGGLKVTAVNRTSWTDRTVHDYRPLFEKLSDSLGRLMRTQLDEMEGDDISALSEMLPPDSGIDAAALMAGMSNFIGPMMLIMMTGSTVGQLGTRAFGSYDLPIPRPDTGEILIVANTLDTFGADWSLPADDLRLWVCIHEVAHHAVMSLPHVRARLSDLLCAHAQAFEADAGALEARLGDFDLTDPESMSKLQETFGNPEVMLGAIRSDEQREILPYIDAIVVTIEGYVDWVLDTIGGPLLSDYPMVTEALRRRRVETDQASRFVERLFGLELTQDKLDRGAAFVQGIIQRAGVEALSRLWDDDDHLPRPSEIEAPGLWLARVGADVGEGPLPELAEDTEIPDFPDLDQ